MKAVAAVRRGVAALFVAASAVTAGAPVEAGDLIQIPLRWCAIRGSDAVENPAGVGEPDTDNVLWRRHERASDNIWIPGATITFRSAFTAAVTADANFPIIDDPRPPSAGGPGQLGDLVDPGIDDAELNEALAACRVAWDAIETRFGTPLEGPLGLNLRRWVGPGGSPTALGGQANFAIGFPRSVGPTGVCLDPTRITANNGDQAFAAVIDNSFTLASDATDRLLAHELGHVLFLGHGNGQDDDSNGVYDELCDPGEDIAAPPPSLMTSGGSSETITGAGAQNQRNTARAVARVTSGTQFDPPAALVNGDTISDHRADPARDVPDASVDLVSAGMAENTVVGTTFVSHILAGTIPFPPNHQFLLFADLDGDPATGGAPATLGFPTGFQGAELVTRVLYDVPLEFASVTPTVWRFEAGAFVEVVAPAIEADVATSLASEGGTPLFDVVTLQLPTAARGPAGTRPRIQALAQRLDPGGATDQLPNGLADAAGLLFFEPPQFPVCLVTPDPVRPGGLATVEATGLIPGAMAKAILGDLMVGGGPIDGAGNATVDFVVPVDARTGPRLMTVGVQGTAVTADCAVEVAGPPIVNHPPACEGARASRPLLWPPNHRLVPVAVEGVTDPDGDPVVIAISGITQDEAVDGPGDGTTSPDGLVQGATALLRAERSGRGNGRVYRVAFEAGDGRGGTCVGSVMVGVPHDRGRRSVPIDDGQGHDSTLP